MRPAPEVALGEAPSEIEDRKCGWFDRDGTDFIPGNLLFEAVTHEFDAAPVKLFVLVSPLMTGLIPKFRSPAAKLIKPSVPTIEPVVGLMRTF